MGGAVREGRAFRLREREGRSVRSSAMTQPPHPEPGGTYGNGDPAEPARRDKFRTDQHIPGPDPSLHHEPDEGHEPVPPESRAPA